MSEDNDNLVDILKIMDWDLKANKEDVSKYQKMVEILESREDWPSKIVRDVLKTEAR